MQNLSEDELNDFIMSVDDDQSGSIEFEEFLGMIHLKSDAMNCEEELLAAFQARMPNSAGREFQSVVQGS